MNFIDTNVLAYAFYQNEHKERCRAVIREGGITDTLNLLEAFHIIEHETRSRDLAQQAVRAVLRSNIHVVDLDAGIIFEAVKTAGNSKLSIFDLVHCSSALASECTSILSYDRDFDGLAIERREP